jgi:hypothetical protein
MDQNYKLIINRASSFGSHLTKGVSALSSAAMGVTTLTNAINALGEEGLTFSTLSSLLMSISMTLPSLIGLFNIMASGIHNVSLGYIKLNTA